MFARFLILAAVVLGSLTAMAEGPGPYGEGLPLPWPFPWAKECPVKWTDLRGRYMMVNSGSNDVVSVRISVLSRNGLKLMRISRYAGNGWMIADGFSFVTDDQKAVRVYMWPKVGGLDPMWANLRLYYRDNGLSCAVDRLVPILSLIQQRANITTETQYRLLRL